MYSDRKSASLLESIESDIADLFGERVNVSDGSQRNLNFDLANGKTYIEKNTQIQAKTK